MNDYNIEKQSLALNHKEAFIRSYLSKVLEKNKQELSEEQFESEVAETLESVLNGPLYQNRMIDRGSIPFKEEFQEDMLLIKNDLDILTKENKLHSEFLKSSFNAVNSEKKRIMQRIDKLNSLTGDMFLLTDSESKNTHYITESFNDSSSLDTDFSMEGISKGSVQSEEGILTLERTSNKNLSQEARISHLTGNGKAGTDKLARKTTTLDRQGQAVEAYRFINHSDDKMHTRIEDVLDDKPDTLFEYQMINVPTSFKEKRRFYDFDWAKGEEEGETLRLKLIIELDREETINWLTLSPYYADDSSGRLLIHSIRTSTNGFDYKSLYKDTIIDTHINITPQTYRVGDIFTGETEEDTGFYQGKGVWSFPQRKARFIEFVIDQKESYKENIGQAVYYLVKNNEEEPIQVEEPHELKDSPPGRYTRTVDNELVEYVKVIEATREGWRYAIGIRDINIMQFSFNEKSEFISKRYELPRNAQKVTMHSKEIIPESYLDIVSRNNDWIQYEITFDDVNWHRISPLHHEPMSDNFPAKIIEVNSSLIDLANSFKIHKKLIETEEANYFRFRVSLHRPDAAGYESTTPILEEIAFKIEMEDEL